MKIEADAPVKKMIHSSGNLSIRKPSPMRFQDGDTVHMKNGSFHRGTLARDSTFGARSDSWEVLRVGLLNVERSLFRARSTCLRTLAYLASLVTAAGPPRRRADSGGTGKAEKFQ